MIHGLEYIVGPALPGATTWAEFIAVRYDDGPVVMHRELADPTAGTTTAQALAYRHGYHLAGYVPYARDWSTGYLQEMAWTDIVKCGTIVVIIDHNVPGGIPRVIELLGELPQLLSHRMVWPVLPAHNPRPIPPPDVVFTPHIHYTGD